MDVSFCISALEEALARFGKPEIFNTDQGSQFTSAAFTATLASAGVRISMDGRGRWMDDVFIERLWRSLKHEDIYLKGYVAPERGSPSGLPSTTTSAHIRHWPTGRRWRSGGPVSVARSGAWLWIWRCAWTTQARCPSAAPYPQPPQQQQAARHSWKSERRRLPLNFRSDCSLAGGPLQFSLVLTVNGIYSRNINKSRQAVPARLSSTAYESGSILIHIGDPISSLSIQ